MVLLYTYLDQIIILLIIYNKVIFIDCIHNALCKECKYVKSDDERK